MTKTFQFQFSPKAEKEFSKLQKSLQKRILKKLFFFEAQKSPLEYAKPLTGLEKIFRFRIGEYRIIITPKDKTTLVVLLILKIAHRKNVYKE